MVQIKALEFVDRDVRSLPESATAGLRADLEDGKRSTFAVATADQPGRRLKDADFDFGAPVLFVRRLDEETVASAAQTMAADMGGYWLRYYNTPAEAGGKKKRKPAAPGCKVVSAAISEVYPPRADADGCAVVQARIGDGREFSLLTATPTWFERAFRDSGLAYYYGPSILFVKRLEPKLVRRAVNAMAAQGDDVLCRYDTPRRTLPEVLADFKARRARDAA